MKVLVSAGDAVTAKLVKEYGFDGIWVSGFEACCRLGIPDNGTITMEQMLRICEPIVKATDLPVYVDCDTGYRMTSFSMAYAFYNIGVRGICVEDNIDDKENSLFGGKMPLKDAEVFAEYIGETQASIEVIARTEALIRGYGFGEAERRARLYREAGADYVMIHSRDKTGIEAMELYNRGMTEEMPLVIVPTKFPTMKNDDFDELGYKMVIWANQTERCKIKATRECLESLKQDDNMLYVEAHLSASLEEMRGLMA